MASGFNQKVNFSADLMGRISNLDSRSTMSVAPWADTEAPSFKNVMGDLVQNVNQEINAPDKLMKDVMAGNSDVDIHDVMTAMAKAEITVSVATQITSKVIQAYDKIMQISV